QLERRADPPDQAGELPDLLVPEPARGLVEQQQARARSEGAGELDPLHRPERQPGRRTAGDALEPELREQLLRGPLAARMPSDLDVLEHRHAREELDVLERPRDAPADDPVGRRSQQALAGEGDLARIRAVQAGDQVEERRLAGAVRADQPGNLALLDREPDVVDGDDAAEPLP